MLQLQEAEDRKTPAATTWCAKFLLRAEESREFLGSWISSGAILEAKKRRATQVITYSFPCGKRLQMIGARASSRCELCRRERRHGKEAIEHLPGETVAHIQIAGCKAQKKSVIGAHNRCWKYLLCAITQHGKAKRNFEFIGEDKDKQLESSWRETNIENVLPWEDIADKAVRLLAISKGGLNAAKEGHDDEELENDQEVERDETDPYNAVTFGRRRPDSVEVTWANKVLYVLEFKRTSDQGADNRERGESRAMAQHDILVRSLKKVAEDAEDENGGRKIKLIIFVGGTSGSVHAQTLNESLKELQVIE
jgi:hypothetical protein